MGGETLSSTQLSPKGIPGDRCWAVRDVETNEIRSAKQWPMLLNYRAKLPPGVDINEDDFDKGLYGDALPDIEIACPDGQSLRARDPDIAEQLSSGLGKKATLTPLAPPDDLDHYRLAKELDEEHVAEALQLQPGETLMQYLAKIPPEMQGEILGNLQNYVTPPGTYFDAMPLHVLTTASLDYLRTRAGVDAVVQRYRPNLLIEPANVSPALVENDWIGKRLHIGKVVMRISMKTMRCAMPSRQQTWCDLEAEKGMARAMVEHCERHFGVYAVIEQAGEIKAGDEVHLLTD
jgi:uncharacterized protein YcbX